MEDFSCSVMCPHYPDEDHHPTGEGDDLQAPSRLSGPPVPLEDAYRNVWLPQLHHNGPIRKL